MTEILGTVATNTPTLPPPFAPHEYQLGMELFRHWSSVRRQDMVFVTTVQGAVLTILGAKLPMLNTAGVALSSIAFFVVLLGWNSERRISGYARGYAVRLQQLESDTGMCLFRMGAAEVSRMRMLASNMLIFGFYYAVLAIAWVAIWGWNVWHPFAA